MPSLFRRKSSDVVEDATSTVSAPETEPALRSKAYTPSKKDLGVVTPKRGSAQARRTPEAPPANRREAYRRSRARQKAERAEARAGMMAGKEEYLLPRDKGAERALVRDVVDARRNIGTWFFAGALIVIVGSSQGMPLFVQFAANALWVLLAAAVVVDSALIVRRLKKAFSQKLPKYSGRMFGHYAYGLMRSITFRRMRMPAPRVRIGDSV